MVKHMTSKISQSIIVEYFVIFTGAYGHIYACVGVAPIPS